MIPRERKWILLTIFTFATIDEVRLQGERAYDTSEWIPITPSSLQTSSSEIVEEKTASDRVLSLDSPAQQKFFPDKEYEYTNRRPNQVQQFLRESPPKKGFELPRPRKLKHPSDYKFETPPPPPSRSQPQINYYNGENMSPFIFEKPLQASRQVKSQQNYYVSPQQLPNQPVADRYVGVPSINPQVPAPDAPNLYEQYQLPFNASFYQSLNPSSINNEFYHAINTSSQNIQSNGPNIPTQQILQSTISKPSSRPKPNVEQETVQLVYVPVENLKPNHPNVQNSRSNYQQVDAPKQEKHSIPSQINHVPLNFHPLDQPRQEKLLYNPSVQPQNQELVYPPVDVPHQEKLVSSPPEQINNKQARLESINQDFIQQTLQAYKLQQQLRNDINPLNEDLVITTASPKKKPHQPPLAVFLESQKKAEISDVLNMLRNAKTISVQDRVSSDSPQIFIGPSNLDSPDGYTKFPLPYLNNINGNRIERKIDQLPFFVAPVSYNAPPGYSKISLPSPHVGSVVVSVPHTSTTPEPLFFNQNQVNPFSPSGYSSNGQSGLQERPQQNILDTYFDHNRGRYQSTPVPQVTESSFIPSTSDIFGNNFAPRQPNPYYTEQQNSNQETYKDNIPTLDAYRPQVQEEPTYRPQIQEEPSYRPQVQEEPRFPSHEETPKIIHSTVTPKQNSREQSQLPDVNPLELAINEFELHQINNEFEQHNKVKHSTTRRPQTIYDDNQSVSNTRTPPTRGRHTFENERTTEKSVSRGRIRGRGRGSSSRTTSTTTTTARSETDRYTVLEEFNVREPLRSPSTESVELSAAEVETESPRRTTTPFNGSPYLPEETFDSRRPQTNFGTTPAQDYNDFGSQLQFETPSLEQPKRRPVLSLETQEPQTTRRTNDFYSGNGEIENVPANVYSLSQQTYESADFDRPRSTLKPTRLVYENIEPNSNVKTEIGTSEKPKLEEATPTYIHRFSPEVTSYENREPNQRRPQEELSYQQYEIDNNKEPDQKQLYHPETYESPREQHAEEQKTKQQSVEDTSSFLESLNQPNFDQTYISLQDQAVRSLLVPNLLVPSTKLESPSTNKYVASSTESFSESPSSTTEAVFTTTTRASRTRGRGRTRPTTTASSVTSPRRASNRRRPVSRTSTESPVSSTEYSSGEDNSRFGLNTKQRFRTRGRQNQNEITDRISTTQNEVRVFKQPKSEGGFEGLISREPPQSYMQFEHAIDEQQIITINPNLNQEPEIKEYHQVYSLPQPITPGNQQTVLEYENTKTRSQPILDVQITHVVPEENEDVLTRPTEEEEYVRYSNANIKSGGVLNNNKATTTTTAGPSTRARGRTRGRSRFATTTANSRSVTRTSNRPTSASSRITTQKEEQDSYGFTRQPSYTPANLNIQATRVSSSSLTNDEPSIKFVGEIRPKYSARPTTPLSTELDAEADTTKPKIRARTRASARKVTNNYRQLDNDVSSARSSEQVTRRSGIPTRTRGRGASHYRAPENVKRESEDEDVANQNYPVNFLQKLDASSPKPTTAAFQITIDPLDEETDDQSPYSSFYRPKFVLKPDQWTDPNGLSSEDKSVTWNPSEILESETTEILPIEEPQALGFIHTTENSQQLPVEFTESEVDKVMLDLEKIKTLPREQSLTTPNPTEESSTKKPGRRRGVWKLVRHRPIDPLEVSESQNYQTVLNAFDSIEKVNPYTKDEFNPEKPKLNKYLNKDLSSINFQQEINSFMLNENIKNSFETQNTQEDIEEVVTVDSYTEPETTEPITDTTAADIITTTPSTTKTQENIFDTIYEMFGIFEKSEKKSNNISSESSNVATTTVVNPTFPEEFTEIPTTPITENIAKTTKISFDFNEDIKNSNRDDPIENLDRDYSETTETILPTTLVAKISTKPYEVAPWKMREVKTSTSTEVSHETEICYKGRCVKSKERKKHKLI